MYGTFWKNIIVLDIALKIHCNFGISRCLEIRIFWSKPLKIEYATLSNLFIRFGLRFDTALIMTMQIC